MFTFSRSHIIEWGDCDPAGLVFYPRYFVMFDSSTAYMLEAASGLSRSQLMARENILGWPMVDSRAQFLAAARFDDRVQIETKVVHIGRTSFGVEHTLKRGEVTCVQAREVRVWAAGGKELSSPIVPVALPTDLRACLSATAGGKAND